MELLSTPSGRHGRPMEPWMTSPADKPEEKIASLLCNLNQDFLGVTRQIVPWYLRNFPASYFREVCEATRMEHLKGLTALKGINQDISLTLSSQADDQSYMEVTVLRTTTRPGTLQEMLEAMGVVAGGARLRRVKVFDSFDGTTALNIFTYDRSSQEVPEASLEDLAQLDEASREELKDYLRLCEPDYV